MKLLKGTAKVLVAASMLLFTTASFAENRFELKSATEADLTELNSKLDEILEQIENGGAPALSFDTATITGDDPEDGSVVVYVYDENKDKDKLGLPNVYGAEVKLYFETNLEVEVVGELPEYTTEQLKKMMETKVSAGPDKGGGSHERTVTKPEIVHSRAVNDAEKNCEKEWDKIKDSKNSELDDMVAKGPAAFSTNSTAYSVESSGRKGRWWSTKQDPEYYTKLTLTDRYGVEAKVYVGTLLLRERQLSSRIGISVGLWQSLKSFFFGIDPKREDDELDLRYPSKVFDGYIAPVLMNETRTSDRNETVYENGKKTKEDKETSKQTKKDLEEEAKAALKAKCEETFPGLNKHKKVLVVDGAFHKKVNGVSGSFFNTDAARAELERYIDNFKSRIQGEIDTLQDELTVVIESTPPEKRAKSALIKSLEAKLKSKKERLANINKDPFDFEIKIGGTIDLFCNLKGLLKDFDFDIDIDLDVEFDEIEENAKEMIKDKLESWGKQKAVEFVQRALYEIEPKLLEILQDVVTVRSLIDALKSSTPGDIYRFVFGDNSIAMLDGNLFEFHATAKVDMPMNAYMANTETQYGVKNWFSRNIGFPDSNWSDNNSKKVFEENVTVDKSKSYTSYPTFSMETKKPMIKANEAKCDVTIKQKEKEEE